MTSAGRTPRRHTALGAAATLVLAATVGCGAGTESPRVLATLNLPPVATPKPTPVDTGLAAFVAAATGGKLSYHASYRGTVAGSATTLVVSGVIDVSGADYAAATTYRFGKSRVAVGVRYVAGKAWIRGTGAWRRLANFRQSQSNSPFAFVDGLSDLKLVKAELVAGKKRTHLTFASARLLGPEQIPAVNLTEETISDSKFTLVVDEVGRPVSGAWVLKGTGRVSGQLQEIVAILSLTFSKVGSKIAIKAP